MNVRTPRTVAQATQLLERHAELEGRLALAEAARSEAIGRANASADAAAAPLLEEMRAIAEKLEPWWRSAREALAGKRKSIELGGCMIGTKMSRPKLAHGFEDDDKAVEALRASRYAKHTTRVRYSIDRAGTLKLLQVGGRTSETLRELGFSVEEGRDCFFVERAEQAGTMGAGR
jgi:hypothetical protein